MAGAMEMAAVLKRIFEALDQMGTGKIHRDGLSSILTKLVGLTPVDAEDMLDGFCQGRSFVEYKRFLDYCAGVEMPEADEVLDWTFSKWLRAPKIAEIIAGSVFERLGPGSDLDAARQLASQLTGPSELQGMLQASGVLEKLANYLFDQLQALLGSVAVNVDEYNGKFNGFHLAFGNMSKFHRGLDDVVGLPSSNLREAMQHEHCGCDDSQATFETSNYGIKTTSEIEWHFVVNPDQWQGPGPWPHEEERKLAREKWRSAPESFQLDVVMATLNGELEQQNLALLLEVEGVGARLYTGPMFMKYNAVLRGKSSDIPALSNAFRDLCKGNEYTSTLHVINSCLIKLSGLTKVERVYRGMSGGKLPEQFTKRDQFQARGGVEAAFMSTTLDRSVAMHYAAGAGAGAGVVIEMQQGLTDRGADLSRLSQYPHEREICFPPLCGIQLLDTRVEGGVLVASTRASVNMKALTIDKVLGQRRQLLVDVAQNETRVLLGELKTSSAEAAAQAVAEKILQAVVDEVKAKTPEACNDADIFKAQLNGVLEVTGLLRRALAEEPRAADAGLREKLRDWRQATTSAGGVDIPVGIFGNSETLARHMGDLFCGTHATFRCSEKAYLSGQALESFRTLQHLVIKGLQMMERVHTGSRIKWLEALPKLCSLQHLDLGDNSIGDEGCAKLAEALPQLPSLQHLLLPANRIGPVGCAELAKTLPLVPSLRQLSLSSNFLGDQGCARLAEALPGLPGLEQLHVGRSHIGSAGLAKLAEALPTSLQQLALSANDVGDVGCLALARALPRLSSLLQLEFASVGMGPEGLAPLAEALAQRPSLQHLDLGGNAVGAGGGAGLAEALRPLSNLRQLNLSYFELSGEGCTKLAEVLPRLGALQHLDLSGNVLDLEGCAQLAEALPQLSYLRHLNINRIGAEGCMKLVQALPRLPGLEHLDLSGQGLDAAACRSLAEALSECSALQHLDLNSNHIDGQGCASLAEALPKLSSLRHLNLYLNDLGDDGCAKLAEVLPHLRSLQHLNLGHAGIGAPGGARLAEALLKTPALQHLDVLFNDLGEECSTKLAEAWKPRPSEDIKYLL